MDSIAVLDFGCQYTHQIGEAVRKAGVYSEILPCDVPLKELERFKGIILSGGPDAVYREGSPKCDPGVFDMGKPVLGVCYGLQLMAHELGGEVKHIGVGEYGSGKIKASKGGRLLNGFDDGDVWMSHGDSVIQVPKGFEVMARSDKGILAAMGDEERKIYGLQFHPEVAHTPGGQRIIDNFVLDISGCNPEWSTGNYIDSAVEGMREKVGDGHAVVFASGGVDSSLALYIANKALGKKVKAIHIDNGFQRKGEAEWVRKTLNEAGIEVDVFDASGLTLGRIGGELDPERKRHIIGDAFVEALYSNLRGFEDDDSAYLVQGTIYPDSIESGEGVGRSADTIKSHHNVASELIRKLKAKGRVVEPNIRLFKHEVREAARMMGLPREISERHPFPGPGLGVRYVGRVLRGDGFQANAERARSILGEYGLEGVVVPVGNVGVKGSARAYGNAVLIYGDRDRYDDAREASNRLGNEIRGVTRAGLVLDGSRHSQDEWAGIRDMPITEEGLEMLREADDIAMRNLRSHGLYDRISQMPVVLFPGPEKPWVCLRPVVTPDFMTLRTPDIPGELTWDYLDNSVRDIMDNDDVRGLGGLGGVVLDTTNKPPATTEWE